MQENDKKLLRLCFETSTLQTKRGGTRDKVYIPGDNK